VICPFNLHESCPAVRPLRHEHAAGRRIVATGSAEQVSSLHCGGLCTRWTGTGFFVYNTVTESIGGVVAVVEARALMRAATTSASHETTPARSFA